MQTQGLTISFIFSCSKPQQRHLKLSDKILAKLSSLAAVAVTMMRTAQLLSSTLSRLFTLFRYQNPLSIMTTPHSKSNHLGFASQSINSLYKNGCSTSFPLRSCPARPFPSSQRVRPKGSLTREPYAETSSTEA